MASTGGSSRQARTATVGFKTEAKLVKLPVTTVSTTGVSQAGDSSVSSTQATAGGGLIKSTTVRNLIRQPSYCKILDDLKGAEARVGHGVNLKQGIIHILRKIKLNLFVTSKNETTNSPIHEFIVLHKVQRAF